MTAGWPRPVRPLSKLTDLSVAPRGATDLPLSIDMHEPEHFSFLLLPEFTHLAFSCAVEPLRIANLVSGRTLYRWTLISEDGRNAVASCGVQIAVDAGLDASIDADHLFVVSGINVENHVSPAVLSYLRRLDRHGQRIGAICSGAFVLAKAGLLNGRPCAIHWAYHDEFRDCFPQVALRHSVFVTDGPVITASGGPAASDLMLYLIGQRHGAQLASRVADQMVYGAIRNDTSEQRASVSARFASRNEPLAKAIRLMESSTEFNLSIEVIARRAGVTVRQLQRLFRRFVGRTPHQYYEEVRLQKARTLLRQTDNRIIEIAISCGFHSASNFSRKYKRMFGRSPRFETLV